jgi:hypothetical protein
MTTSKRPMSDDSLMDAYSRAVSSAAEKASPALSFANLREGL